MSEGLSHEKLLLILGAITALLAVLGPLMTTAGAAVGSWITARRAAQKDEVELLRADLMTLRERVRCLEVENNHLRQENLVLREYIATLRITLREHDIDVPALRDFDDDAWKEKA
jgi:hypothetical protein